MITSREISLKTEGNDDAIDITAQVRRILTEVAVKDGTLTLFVTGSTAGLTLMEYEPGLISDFRNMWQRNIPSNIKYEHDERWGDGNGYSHVRASLLGASLTVPMVKGKMVLGTWQQIVLVDFDNRPRSRKIVLQFCGE
jgi:secondary thiamine-phosphate synthase enzyme